MTDGRKSYWRQAAITIGLWEGVSPLLLSDLEIEKNTDDQIERLLRVRVEHAKHEAKGAA